MSDLFQRQTNRRLRAIEHNGTVAKGEITDDSPLTVALHGSSTGTAALSLRTFLPTVGDVVWVWTRPGDPPLILGPATTTPAGSWISATYNSDWADFSATYHGAQYRKDPFGRVHLRGLVKKATAGVTTTMFTLPAGYRPSLQVRFPVDANTRPAGLQITTAGVVNCFVGGDTTYISLNGVSFDTV